MCLVDQKETLLVNKRYTTIDWKAFLLVNLPRKNPSQPQGPFAFSCSNSSAMGYPHICTIHMEERESTRGTC
jgi:hypothetical protein